MNARTARAVTVHGDVGLPTQLALLDAIEEVLHEAGFEHVWIDPSSTTDLLVLTQVRPT